MEIIKEYDDNENWSDSGVLGCGRCCPDDGNDTDEGESEEERQGGQKGTGKANGMKNGKGIGEATEHGKGNGKGMGMQQRKGRGRGTVKGMLLLNIPQGEKISLVALLCTSDENVQGTL